jgi:hypothetical protein
MAPDEIEQAARFYTQGLPLALIGTRLVYDPSTVHRALPKAEWRCGKLTGGS